MTPRVPEASPVRGENRNHRLILLTILIVVSIIAPSVSQSSGEPPAGFIVDAKGSWISSRTGAPLRQIDPVFADEQIAPMPPYSEGNFISIALYDSTKKTLRCRSASDCDAGYKIPQVSKPDSFLTRVTEAIRQLYPTQVRKFVVVASRGASGPLEAVLKVEKDGVADLAAALTAVKPGSYTAQLIPWPGQDGTQAVAISGALKWNRPVGDWKPSSPVAPGLYRLVLTDTNGATVGPKVMVLVQKSPEYKKFSQALERFDKTAAGWEVEDNEAMRRLRIGLLMALWRNPGLAESRE